MKPKRRKADLVVEKLLDETLIYDLVRNKAYCLNRTSSLVWNRCDGKTGAEDLAGLLEKELGVKIPEDMVGLALDGLDRAKLLVPGQGRAPHDYGCSRRAVIGRLGLAGVVGSLIPVITTLVAPTAASAITCVADADCKRNPRAFVGLCCCSARKKCLATGKCSGAVC